MKYERLTDRILAEMLINTEGESWDSDNIEAQCYIRLAELEDKIERGELISTVQDEQSEQEIEFFVEHNAAVRKQAVEEFAASVKSAFYYEFDELIPSIMADKIDALVKEVCGDDSSRAGKTEEVAS